VLAQQVGVHAVVLVAEGLPLVAVAGDREARERRRQPVTLSVTTTSGCTSSQMAMTRSWEYCAAATSVSQMGFVTVEI